MYIYIFGSICRGEIDKNSDVDLLSIFESEKENMERFESEKYSIYSLGKIKDLWDVGSPFAWHLYLESRLIFSSNGDNIIKDLGEPNQYKFLEDDLKRFYHLYIKSKLSLITCDDSYIFDLSMIFLAIRNFASCYSIGALNDYVFSRKSALLLKSNRLEISDNCFSVLERARLFSTRGLGEHINRNEKELVMNEFGSIDKWFNIILKELTYE